VIKNNPSKLRNITLSADADLIRKVREKCLREHTTLNSIFRRWMRQYLNKSSKTADFQAFMSALDYVSPGRRFSREEMNER
jgi:hypothetical protein